ncbi:MAG TPA: response regulator, partial [Anaerolineales bacterium]|nr:response regulator [Anaerolineales bacterium]
MDNNTPHILFVDDDLNLLKTLGKIFKAKDFEVILAQTGGAALAYIERQPMSVVLIDLKLGDMSGLDVLRGVKAFSPDSECILLTGNASQASAIQAIQMGAFGYIQKPFEVDQIVLSVQRAADKYLSTLALRESEEKYRRLFDRASLGIFQSTPQGKVISVNPAFARMFGYDSIEDAVQSIRNVATDVFVDPNRRAEIIRMMEENPGLRSFENVYRRKDGSTFIGNLNTMPVMDTNRQLIRVEGIIEDITKRKQLETAKQAQLQISLFS